MKGCLILQRQFAPIGHALARHLQERYGVAEFCGYVFLRSSERFLSAQTDVRYSSLLLDEEVHDRYRHERLDRKFLANLEQEIGTPFLWPALTLDRVLMSGQLVREYPHDRSPYTHEELLRLIQVHAKAIKNFLERERPDFVFSSIIGGVGSYLLTRLAQQRGLPTYCILMTCIRNRYILSQDMNTFTGVDAKMRSHRADLRTSPSRQDAQDFLQAFRTQPFPYYEKSTPVAQPVSRQKQFKFLQPDGLAKTFAAFGRNLSDHYTSGARQDYSTIGPWNYLRDAAHRKLRNLIGVEDLYDDFDPEADFAFFPLQLEPEVSLLYQAPYYTDQAHLIGQIARSLPVQYILYVKEHPEMVPYRPRSFYERLKKMPNVKLIRPTVSSFAITPRAKLVLTITSTVGWEAVLLKKPVILFGHHFYETLSMVRYCREIEGLPRLVKEQLESFRHDEDELLDYLTALFEDSIPMNLHHLWLDEPDPQKKAEGVRPLAEALAKRLGLPARV